MQFPSTAGLARLFLPCLLLVLLLVQQGISISVSTKRIVKNVPPVTPEVQSIVTTTTASAVSGFFETRYGFKGDYTKLAGSLLASQLDEPVTVSIVAGQKSLTASASLLHLLAPGVKFRVGDQDLEVTSVSSTGKVVTFTPYHSHGASSAYLWVPDTLVGSAKTGTGATILTTMLDMSGELAVSDSFLVTRAEVYGVVSGNTTQFGSQVLKVSAITGTTITPVTSLAFTGSAYVSIYRMKNRLMRIDSTHEEIKAAYESMSAVGSVEVTRFGPTSLNGFTWSVTYTSTYGSTEGCASGSLSSCSQVYGTSSTYVTVSSSVAPSSAYYGLSGVYVSDSFYNGRRQYRGPYTLSNGILGPFTLRYSLSTNLWGFYLTAATPGTQGSTSTLLLTLIASKLSSTTSLQPFGTSLHSTVTGLAITAPTVSTTILATSASVTASNVQKGLVPSLANVNVSHTLYNRTNEVQSVTVTTTSGLLFGGFNLDFNDSLVRVFFRADEAASDFAFKLESLPTIGKVAVTRSTLQNSVTNTLGGYQWLVTFLSDEGDLPLMEEITTPIFGRDLSANGGGNYSLSIAEVTKGVALPRVDYLTGLVPGNQYTVEVYANNAVGAGISTLMGQNEGMGVIPVTFNLFGEPSAPIINSVTSQTSSQLNVQYQEPDDVGGSPISTYIVEYTTNTTMITSQYLGASPSTAARFMIYNKAGNDSEGYWRLQRNGEYTTLLPWGASAYEVQTAINDLSFLEGASVTRTILPPRYGQGFEYDVTLSVEIGPLAVGTGNFTVDISSLTSGSLTDSFQVVYLRKDQVIEPVDYDAEFIYADCAKMGIGANSQHQVVSIYSSTVDAPGTGSFRLTLGPYSTSCLPYTISSDSLQAALESLANVNTVYVQEHKRSVGAYPQQSGYRDLHVYFEGIYPTLEWPMMRADGVDSGNIIWDNTILYSTTCNTVSATINAGTTVTVQAVVDKVACVEGSPEIQVVVAEARVVGSVDSIDGYYYLYLAGEKSIGISANASSSDVEDAINMLSAVKGLNVSVTKYIHNDTPFAGYAWAVTFPASLGNVETMGTDDQYITGVNAAVNVYSLFNMTTTADNDDISGHFRIAFGAEFTVPIAYSATDSVVLNALHNLTNVGKVAMIGTRLFETTATSSFSSSLVTITSTGFTVAANTSTYFEVGDAISLTVSGTTYSTVATSGAKFYIASVNYTKSSLTTVTVGPALSAPFTTLFGSAATLYVGPMRTSKEQLPGHMSVVANSTIYSATYGASIIKTMTGLAVNSYYAINGTEYQVTASAICAYTWSSGVDWDEGSYDLTHYCITLSPTYAGPTVADMNIIVYVFPQYTLLHTSQSWIAVGVDVSDYIWVGDYQLVVYSTTAGNSTEDELIYVYGKNLYEPLEGVYAFQTANGIERSLLFKLATADVKTARVLVEADWRGTNVQVLTARTDGITPGTYLLGAASEVQTVTFRGTSPTMLNATTKVPQEGMYFSLSVGSDTVGYLQYGSSAASWKSALESLVNVDRVTVERHGDGLSAHWSYGYSYTVSFWGKYGAEGIPQMTSSIANLTSEYAANITNMLVSHDTIRNAEYLGDFSARHLSLDENREYALRMRAINAKGISMPSEVLLANTQNYGGLADSPQSMVLGQYRSGNSLSLSYREPKITGGLAITQYVVESDTTTAFDSETSNNYNSTTLAIVPEVQQITTFFRGGDDVKSRGGTFTLTLGGRTSAPLTFDISAFNLEIAINNLAGTRQVSVAPVIVSRVAWSRGYKWTVTFKGLEGDIGLMLVNYDMLVGDEPEMVVEEMTKGNADIVPGEFTYEVQTVSTYGLAKLYGSFVLDMEGYQTPKINHDETAISFKKKLESLPTIYTVKVTREQQLPASYELYSWTITFTHMKKEVVQGAGNLPPLTLFSSALTTSLTSTITSAYTAVRIFELVKGSHPFQLTLSNLMPAVTYNARVTAYNERGFSLTSAMASMITLGQSPAPVAATATIHSGTQLEIMWQTPDDTHVHSTAVNYQVDGFLVESYSSSPVPAVQVITTSSSSSLAEIQRITIDADANNLAGFFRLTFEGETSMNIPWNAIAEGDSSVAQALARLSTMGPVTVNRAYSMRAVQGLTVSCTNGNTYCTSDQGTTPSLSKGDVIWISGVSYTVSATCTSSNIYFSSTTFGLTTITGASVYKWSYGYTWDVTFINQVGPLSQLVASSSDNWAGTNAVIKVDKIRVGVAPLSGTFRVGFAGSMSPPLEHDISAVGMKMALEQLNTIGEVAVTRFSNGFGFDWRITFISEMGNVTSLYTNDAALVGPFAKASVSSMVTTTLPNNYASVFVAGTGARSTILSGLVTGKAYQVRVRAHNIEGYSASAIASPLFLSPKTVSSPPFNATIFALSVSELKLIWSTPQNLGGASIQKFKIEWDTSADFHNVPFSGNSREIFVDPLDIAGPSSVYCYSIDIIASSSALPRFARIYAFNGYDWSKPGYPTPRSASGAISAPGAPISVTAQATSAVGLLVQWMPPSSATCAFGGDGGSPVTHYVVEWDSREDFGSPAAQATVYPGAFQATQTALSFLIGGRNMLTGVEVSSLMLGAPYYIRVTAFNGMGAGVAGFAPGATYTADVPPDAPANLLVQSADVSSLHVKWDHPARDGGATVEKYRLQYATNASFVTYEALDLPIIPEVQTVVAQSDVVIERQAIRVLTEVTNERQIVRSQINGTDEVQTVTTTCDDVTNEIQRVTTSAIDIDEVQVVELVGSDVDEVQLVQTYIPVATDYAEIQTIEIYSHRQDAVQVIGVILTNIDTSSCSLGAKCSSIESQMQGDFKLSFDPNSCGDVQNGNLDSNWCVAALKDMGITGYDCPSVGTDTCTTNFLTLNNGTLIQEQLCNLKGSGTTTYMQDSDGDCVKVKEDSATLFVSSTVGVYKFSYNVTFVGDTLRGDVPPLIVQYSNMSYAGTQSSNFAFTNSYTSAITGNVHSVGNVQSAGNPAYQLIRGNQPSGTVTLTYECESRVTDVSVTISSSTGTSTGNTVTVTQTNCVTGYCNTVTMKQYSFIYLLVHNTYHMITSVDSTGLIATIDPPYSTASSVSTPIAAEYGNYFSDPNDALGVGVSESCYSQRSYTTSSISPIDSSSDMRTKLRALSEVINDLNVVRTEFYYSNETFIGYTWTITFTQNNGNTNPLICDTTYLKGTNSASGAYCTVTTTREGSLIDGVFNLGTTYPHIYVGTPVDYDAVALGLNSGLPWNIPASYMASTLSSVLANDGVSYAFGAVTVVRVPYTPSGNTRWSGGYLWTVTFTERNGQLPQMTAYNYLNATGKVAVGTQTATLPLDDPGTAVLGNQVSGSYAIRATDSYGVKYNSSLGGFPVQSTAATRLGQALSADEFESRMVAMFNGQTGLVNVTRSALPNAAMGYKYTVTFVGSSVGGQVALLKPVTTRLTATAKADNVKKVGDLCLSTVTCATIGSYVVTTNVQVTEITPGAQLRGAFQLRFNGYTTGALAYDAEAKTVEQALNDLVSVSPSRVHVTRDGPMITPSTQVFGYVWSITFLSNTWIDPTVDHSTYVSGNWLGTSVTHDDVWPSTGYSMAWGKNVGNMPLIGCVSSSLYLTNGRISSSDCLVEEVVPGTAPLHGTFTLSLNTTFSPTINIQGLKTTLPIAHNAFADEASVGCLGCRTSMAARLMGDQMTNIGTVEVTRSAVNPKNGGYTWTITFMRDRDAPGGQFGNACEQKDSFYNLCNSPGNVPSLTYDATSLGGGCVSSPSTYGALSNLVAYPSSVKYTCHLVTIMTGDSLTTAEPPGSKAIQKIYISNPNYDASLTTRTFKIIYTDYTTGTVTHTDCIPVDASARTVQLALESNGTAAYLSPDTTTASGGSRGVIVSEGTDTVNARNGKVFTLYFLDEGPKYLVNATQCPPTGGNPDSDTWTIKSTQVLAPGGVVTGVKYGLTAAQAGVKNGVVQRGRFSSFYVTGETAYETATLKWNALPESLPLDSTEAHGANSSSGSIKNYIESISGHKVNVTRLVIGKYGVVEYEIRFVLNPGETPLGAGDVPILNVNQTAATDGNVYNPQVYELVQGSTGLSGTFTVDLHDPSGPRTVSFEEPALRLERKLNELTTIGLVRVDRYQYPTPRSGGWDAIKVDDGTVGGYEWRIEFLKNTGTYAGFSFPPGSGNIDPLTIVYQPGVKIFGTNVKVQTVNYADGSTPIDGTFTLALPDPLSPTLAMTDPIRYDQQPLEAEYFLESLPNIGQVSTESQYRYMQKIPGVYVSAPRDSPVLNVYYDDEATNLDTPTDIRQLLAPGDLFRVGGLDAMASNGQSAIDGAEIYDLVEVAPQNPIVVPVSSGSQQAPLILPGEMIRMGADNYTVLRTGVEIQVLSVTCHKAGLGECGDFYLTFSNEGVDANTLCIRRSQNSNMTDMTSAAALKQSFDNMLTVDFDDVQVSRSSSYDNTSYVYSIYFQGPSVLGNVNQMTVTMGCTNANPAIVTEPTYATGTKVSLHTYVQGGYTDVQTMRVNVESGYISGGLFRLTATQFDANTLSNTTTNCIPFGASADYVAAQLANLTALATNLLPFTINVSYISTSTLTASSSIFGILKVGSKISVARDSTYYFTVTQILSGVSFVVDKSVYEYITYYSSTNSAFAKSQYFLPVYEVVSDAVQVARYGTGNATMAVVTITETADQYVEDDSHGFFRLRMIFGGLEKLTASCLPFHSTAADIQTAINTLGYDFNGDGSWTSEDYDHVTVSRSGDGTSQSGYGYVYTLRFGGPSFNSGASQVMGNSQPFVQVIDEGHFGSCNDLNGTLSTGAYISYASSVSSKLWTLKSGTTPTSFLQYLQPGDRIRVPTSSMPFKIYTVLSIPSSTTLLVDSTLGTFTASSDSVAILKLSAATPEYIVETTQEGEDSYTYEFFFTGRHLTNPVVPLQYVMSTDAATVCPNHNHYGGQRHGVQITTTQAGDSYEVQTLTLSSQRGAVVSASDGAYWKLVYQVCEGTSAYKCSSIIMPTTSSSYYPGGYSWGLDPAILQTEIVQAINHLVTVNRTGYGSPEEDSTYVYNIMFNDKSRRGYVKTFSILGDRQLTPPMYIPLNTSSSADQNMYELNDLTAVGTPNGYNGTKSTIYSTFRGDITFYVQINSTAATLVTTYNATSGKTTSTISTASSVIGHDTFTWWTTSADGIVHNNVSMTPVNITANKKYQLGRFSGVVISFGSSTGHNVGDKWVFTAVRTTNALPSGASLSAVVSRSGAPVTNQIVVDAGYKGMAYGAVTAYKVPPTFFVQDQTVQIYKLVTNNPFQSTNRSFHYKFTYNITDSHSMNSSSACVSWDATDAVVEHALSAMHLGICKTSSKNCITVTRSVDNVNNPNGYVYSIYFEDKRFNGPFNNNILVLNQTACGSPFPLGNTYVANSTNLGLTKIQFAQTHLPYTRYQIPLATNALSSLSTTYRGATVDRQPLYKVNGNYWAVTFLSNLGDVPSLVAEPTTFLSEGTYLEVYDNVVQGEQPLSHTLSGLLTGVDYNVRVQAYTRGPNRGYGNFTSNASKQNANASAMNSMGKINPGLLTTPSTYSSFDPVSSGIPSGAPPALIGFNVAETLQVNEVQSIIVGASHLREVQTITTSATAYSEVQQISLTAPSGYSVTGHFAIRFPEVQTISIQVSDMSEFVGYFAITYSYNDFTSTAKIASSVAGSFTQKTSCLSIDATAAQVKSALETLDNIDTVNVVRSGYGGYKDYFGYSWSVSFVGNQVAGNVMPLKITYGTSSTSCAASTTTADGIDFVVATLNENQAVGVDTEVQTLTVSATNPIAQGQYYLEINSVPNVANTMPCVEWNATAADLEAALQSLDYVDYVYVERFGNGTKETNYGYTYSVYFTGNGLMPQGNNPKLNTLGLISPTLGTGTTCKLFAYFSNGILYDFSSTGATVTAAQNRPRGFTLQAANTTVATLEAQFDMMPTWVVVNDFRRSLSDDQSGYLWTFVFAESMGNVIQMVCGSDVTLHGSSLNSTCSSYTTIDGNYIGGYFIVGTSMLLPSDVEPAEMASALSVLDGFGDISVSRIGPDNQGGYTWTVTWLTATGDQPSLPFSNSLTGSGTSIKGATLQNGNYLSGSYMLEYQGHVTDDIPYNASAAVLTTMLAPVVGSVSVLRSDVDTEGGSTYTVTFLGIPGSLPLLKPQFHGMLMGAGSSVKVMTKRQGAIASGTSLKVSFSSPLHCSQSQVPAGQCGSVVDSYSIEWGSSLGSVSNMISLPNTYDVQIVRAAATSLYDNVYFTGVDATGYFQLSYNSATTGPISSHASALDVRDALESLPDVETVTVTRTYSGDYLGVVSAVPGSRFLNCVAGSGCPFTALPAGEIISVGGSWYRVAYTYTGGNSLPLALVNDSSILTFYGGAGNDSTGLYRWGRGYEWSVTFLSVMTDSTLPLTSPKHGLSPPDASVSIRSADCVECAYLSGLSVWQRYFLQVRAHNVHGFGGYALTTAIPKEIPGAPTSVKAVSVSGTQIEVFFSPPTGDVSDVSEYTVQWDTDMDFATVTNNANNPSCSTSGFGLCVVQGSAISSLPPYTLLIDYLTTANVYYVRVAARNSVSLETMTGVYNAATDSTVWSDVVYTTTANQPPSAPIAVESIVSGTSYLQVLITPPLTDGGLDITTYFLEWCVSNSFNDPSTYDSTYVHAASMKVLDSDSGKKLYEIPNLTTGKSYWVRASASNSINYGPTTMAAHSATPAGKASQPASVVLSTLSSSNLPISAANVTWTSPTTDGGSPITGYLVEWWQSSSVPEIQQVQFTSAYFPNVVLGNFNLKFGPTTSNIYATGTLSYLTGIYNMRSELMNLGQTATNYSYADVMGDVRVTKSLIPGKGYAWSITFVDNQGDQVPLVPLTLAGASAGESMEVIEVQPGQRAFGNNEVQIISILSEGSTNATALGGFFTLSFNGTETSTSYLSASCQGSDMQRALEQLSNLRTVEVDRNLLNYTLGNVNYAGYAWTVTFAGNVGNQPAIAISPTLLTTTGIAIVTTVYDGDNSLTVTGTKASNAVPGEAPVGYKARIVDKDSRLYTITGLVPGTSYYASVSAINAFGTGTSTIPTVPSITPPKQQPQPPQNVAVSVHPGSSSALDVTYDTPLSDGGSSILYYRIELDTNIQFTNSIYNIIPCTPASLHSVFQVTTSTHANNPIVSGYFNLTVSVNGKSYETDYIPYDATAEMSNESGLLQLVGGVTATVSEFSTNVHTNKDVSAIIFQGDRLQFIDSVTGANLQRFPDEVFNVVNVSHTHVMVDKKVLLPIGTTSITTTVYRVYGERGTTSSSRVACQYDSTLCPVSRVKASGSMQSKFQMLGDVLPLGVEVDRDQPDATGGATWRITFLDASPVGANNFGLVVPTGGNFVKTLGGQTANITITQLQNGVQYSGCTGTHKMPNDKALSNGQYYFARVFAVNEVGFSLPQVAPTSQKPQIVPGPPTAVILSVYTNTQLRVVFNPPASDGGDVVTSYLIEYSTNSDFSQSQSIAYTYLLGAAPFMKIIKGLTPGVFVFVRVSAKNSQGYGAPTATTPSSLNPYQASDGPTNVQLRVTSASMLTVSFGLPINNGGDVISMYRVEWDTVPQFNSVGAAPNKGYVELDANRYNSYTINYLTQGQVYYVRVFARNSAGLGVPTASSPAYAAPALQVPGKAHTVAAYVGESAGQIKVSWQYPRIPWHSIPCSGLVSAPNDCPTEVGGGLPSSTGGSPILEYSVAYNELEDFSGYDSGEQTTTNTQFTLTGLTPGRTYYIRVLARNAQGAGQYCAYTEMNCLVVSNHVSATAKALSS